MEQVGRLEPGAVRSRCRGEVGEGPGPGQPWGAEGHLAGGQPGVMTGLMQETREEEAPRPNPQFRAGAADGQGCQALGRDRRAH